MSRSRLTAGSAISNHSSSSASAQAPRRGRPCPRSCCRRPSARMRWTTRGARSSSSSNRFDRDDVLQLITARSPSCHRPVTARLGRARDMPFGGILASRRDTRARARRLSRRHRPGVAADDRFGQGVPYADHAQCAGRSSSLASPGSRGRKRSSLFRRACRSRGVMRRCRARRGRARSARSITTRSGPGRARSETTW